MNRCCRDRDIHLVGESPILTAYEENFSGGDMTAKVRIKAGEVEFEYEGDAAFSMDDIKELFTHIETIAPAVTNRSISGTASNTEVPDSAPSVQEPNGSKARSDLHVDSIAAKLNVSSGPDLIIAAFAYAHFTLGEEVVSRKDVLDIMKKAVKYYKETYRSNLSASLKSLIGRKINKISDDKYSLNKKEYSRVEALLNE